MLENKRKRFFVKSSVYQKKVVTLPLRNTENY